MYPVEGVYRQLVLTALATAITTDPECRKIIIPTTPTILVDLSLATIGFYCFVDRNKATNPLSALQIEVQRDYIQDKRKTIRIINKRTLN